MGVLVAHQYSVAANEPETSIKEVQLGIVVVTVACDQRRDIWVLGASVQCSGSDSRRSWNKLPGRESEFLEEAIAVESDRSLTYLVGNAFLLQKVANEFADTRMGCKSVARGNNGKKHASVSARQGILSGREAVSQNQRFSVDGEVVLGIGSWKRTEFDDSHGRVLLEYDIRMLPKSFNKFWIFSYFRRETWCSLDARSRGDPPFGLSNLFI